MPTQGNLIEINGITKDYSGHKALSNVSANIAEGRITGLLGPNGAGKTTLIRILNQIIMPDTGSISFCGQPMQAAHIASIGYLPEERGLYKKMKVREQAIYLARLRGLSKNDARQRVDTWLEKLGIAGWAQKKVEELSKGMQQKVQFAVTVLHRPSLLIFDEPFSGFDPVSAEQIKNEILELNASGCTIIFSTHNMASVEELCHEIVLINKAEKILEGSVGQVKAAYRDNIYRIEFQGYFNAIEASLTSNFQILSQEKQGSSTLLRLRLLDTGIGTNGLISQLLPYGQIARFEEELPSMNSIFLKAVSGNPTTKY
jgi:ABC-2 type transport system ATP-binding protein